MSPLHVGRENFSFLQHRVASHVENQAPRLDASRTCQSDHVHRELSTGQPTMASLDPDDSYGRRDLDGSWLGLTVGVLTVLLALAAVVLL